MKFRIKFSQDAFGEEVITEIGVECDSRKLAEAIGRGLIKEAYANGHDRMVFFEVTDDNK